MPLTCLDLSLCCYHDAFHHILMYDRPINAVFLPCECISVIVFQSNEQLQVQSPSSSSPLKAQPFKIQFKIFNNSSSSCHIIYNSAEELVLIRKQCSVAITVLQVVFIITALLLIFRVHASISCAALHHSRLHSVVSLLTSKNVPSPL